jgi:hypothetical protein
MPVTHSAAIAQQHHLFLQNRSKRLSIPLYHILILAWNSLVILYGETGLSPPFLKQSLKDGFAAAGYH